MVKKSSANLIGGWSFLVGLVLAVLLGVGFTGPYATQMLWAVFLIGLVVGLLNITAQESSAFLVSGTVLVLVSYLGAGVLSSVEGVGVSILVSVLNSILTLFVPATIIVALRSVFVLAKR
ncbi:MAG: hypothetical protein AABX05_03595 [Nanoarchaeota archaeon]